MGAASACLLCMAPSPQSGLILIVEEPSIRRLVKNVLQRKGHAVLEADARRALRLVEGHETVVKLLITNLPHAFAELEGTVPILYLATSPDWDLAARTRRLRVLQKPFRTQELLEAVGEITERS